jgi:hypothetical protein
MGRMRVTIAGSMGLVALAAVGIAALRHPSPLVASGAFSIVVAVLFVAIVAALSLPGRRRAICGSFAVCGTGYLVLSLGSWTTMASGPHLVTHPLADLSYRATTGHDGVLLHHSGVAVSVSSVSDYWKMPQHPVMASGGPGFLYQRSTLAESPDTIRIVPWPVSRIAHSLFALNAAAAGSLFALLLTRPPHAEPPDHP